MLVVKLDLNVLDLILGKTGSLECCRESCIPADVGLCACLALGLDAAELGVFADEIELVYGKSRKLLKGMGLAVLDDLVYERCLADGDAVLICFADKLIVSVGDILAEHRAVLEQCVDLACKLSLECIRVIAINAGDRQQDGVLKLA